MYKKGLSLIAAAALVASLEANTLSLDPIVVTATKTEQSTKNITSNVDVITAQEIEEKHITSISEALMLISGISVVSNGGLGKSTSVFLRGFDSKRVLVLIDGVRYNDISNSLDGASFEHLMVNQIEQIEVIKGAQSGIWGSEASAGVINIITKKANPGTSLNAHLDYGSFNTKKYGASIGQKTDKFEIRLGADEIKTDGFTSYARRYSDIDDYEDDGYKNRTLNLRGGYHIDDANLLRMAHTDIDVYTEYDNTSSDSRTASYTKKEKLSQIAYENRSDSALTTFHANRSTFRRDYSTGMKYYGGENEYGLSSEIRYADDDFLLLGGDRKSFEHLNSLNKKFTDKALFVTNSNTFDHKIIFTESLRSDHYDAFDNKTTGKIGIKYNVDSEMFFSSNYGTGYNVPTLYQLYDPTYGTVGLTPEDTRSYDLSFGYSGFEITGFYNRVNQMIEYYSGKYRNIDGISTLRGVEVSYKKNVVVNTLLSLNYTRLRAKDKDNFDLPRRAKENFKFGIDYYGIEKFHFGVFGEYVGERVEYTYGTHTVSAHTGNYTVTNAVVNYDLSKNVKIYGKIDNITDKYYQSANNYATSPRAYAAGMEVSF